MAERRGSFFIEKDDAKIAELVERGFGVQEKDGLLLSVPETAYLVEKKRIEVREGGTGGKALGAGEILREFGKEDRLLAEKCAVYKLLRESGHVARIAKEGSSYFRVYRRGKRAGDEPSKYLVKVVGEDWKADVAGIEDELKKASALRKELALAVVKNGEVSFIAIGRTSFE